MKISNGKIIYNLNNESEKVIFNEFQKYRIQADKYFTGEHSAENVLKFLNRGLEKYKIKLNELHETADRQISESQLFNIIYYEARIEEIEKLIAKINNNITAGTTMTKQERHEKSKTADSVYDEATDYIINYDEHILKSRGSGTPKNEPTHYIQKPFKVPVIYRILEEGIKSKKIKLKNADIKNYMLKTLLGSDLKPIGERLGAYLRSKNKQEKRETSKKTEKSEKYKKKT